MAELTLEDEWRGFIGPSNRQAWFDSYTSLILPLSEWADDHGVTSFVVGTELGGSVFPVMAEIGTTGLAGTQVSVEFEFRCNLNQGVYFLNCGVTGNGGQQVHRVIDALAFRVLPAREQTSFGHVDFAYVAGVQAASC